MREPVFLSASIPDRNLNRYTPDPLAIREAVLALVAVIVREGDLVFGGHPAISPLVEHAARSLKAVEHVHIFQSRWFENLVPPEARAFPNLHWTPRGRDLTESLRIMRGKMLNFRTFRAGVFIGGMEGVEEECDVFKLRYSRGQIFPVASTQGAALRLWDRGEGPQDAGIRNALATDKHYRALFRRLLR